MTVREQLEAMLVEHGMFESQAKEVLDLSIPVLNNLVEDYRITFDAASGSYHPSLYAIWFKSIKPVALKWIVDNKPRAWFKPMFEN